MVCYLLTSLRIFDVMTNCLTQQWPFWRHDTPFAIMKNFLMSCHTLCRHDKHFDVMTYFWHHDELFDFMTYFWRHDERLTSWRFLTSWRTFWRFDEHWGYLCVCLCVCPSAMTLRWHNIVLELIDILTYLSRYNKLLPFWYVMTHFFAVMTNFLTS